MMTRFGLVFLPAILLAQTPAPKLSHQSSEEFEQAHKPLIQPERPRSKDAAAATVQVSGALPARGAAAPVRRKTFVDKYVFARMAADKVPHAPLASDDEFARRAWLDATGRIPEPAALSAFLTDRSPNKRDQLVDKLTSSDAFIDKWTYYFEDLFRAGGEWGPD